MQNEPNFQKSQMFITLMKTRNYSEKMKLDTWSKRTQTNPILPVLVADKIAMSQNVKGCDYHLSGILIRSLHFGHTPVLPAYFGGSLNLLPHEQAKRMNTSFGGSGSNGIVSIAAGSVG